VPYEIGFHARPLLFRLELNNPDAPFDSGILRGVRVVLDIHWNRLLPPAIHVDSSSPCTRQNYLFRLIHNEGNPPVAGLQHDFGGRARAIEFLEDAGDRGQSRSRNSLCIIPIGSTSGSREPGRAAVGRIRSAGRLRRWSAYCHGHCSGPVQRLDKTACTIAIVLIFCIR
jgi:hypothetical protein